MLLQYLLPVSLDLICAEYGHVAADLEALRICCGRVWTVRAATE